METTFVMHRTLLTKHEAARFLRISCRTLDRLRAQGAKLGAIKIGAQVRFERTTLEEYLKKCSVQ